MIATTLHPDAELIAMCAQHSLNRDAVNNGYDGDMTCDDATWMAYEATQDAIRAAKPQTLDGWIAKAQAAKAEARCLDLSENPEGCPAAGWAWDLMNDMLRLTGSAAA